MGETDHPPPFGGVRLCCPERELSAPGREHDEEGEVFEIVAPSVVEGHGVSLTSKKKK